MKTDRNNLFGLLQATFLTILITGMGQLFSVLSNVFLARSFSLDTYGHYAFALILAKIGSQVCLMGSMGLLAREWGRAQGSPFEREKHVWRCSLSVGFYGLIACLSLILFYSLYSQWLGNWVVLFVAFLIIPFWLLGQISIFYTASGKVFVGNVIQTLPGLILFLLSLLLFFHWVSYHSVVFFYVFLVLLALSFIGLFYLMAKYATFRMTKPAGCVRSFAIAGIGALLFCQVDIFLIRLYLGVEAVAVYSIVLQLSALIYCFSEAIKKLIYSRLSFEFHQNRLTFQASVFRYSNITICASAFIALFVVALSFFVPHIYGQAYHPATKLICMLGVGYLFEMICGPVVLILNVMGHEKIVKKSYLYALAGNIVIGLLLILQYQLIGIAIATILVTWVWAFFLGVYCFKKTGYYTSSALRFLLDTWLLKILKRPNSGR